MTTLKKNNSEEKLQLLIETALEIRKNAYVPYSHYAVGAAVLTASGKIFTGVNVENAAYPVTLCGERNAIFSAVTQGETKFDTIVIATRNGGSPCGSCRQVMAEFGLDTRVVTVDETGKIVLRATVAELLPGAFVPESLQST